MNVKVQELQKIPVSRFWEKTSISQPKEQVSMIRDFYASNVMDFFEVPLQKDAFVLFEDPVVASRNVIDFSIYNPDGPGVYRKLNLRISLRSPHLPSEFVVSDFKYLGNGEFLVEHKYRSGFSFKKFFLLIFKLVIIVTAAYVVGLMFLHDAAEEAKRKNSSSPT